MATNYGDITPTQAAHSAKELLKQAQPYMVLEQFGNLKPLPSSSTDKLNFRRHVLPVPTDPTGFILTEGVTPPDGVATMENYDLHLKQYGHVLSVSDVVDETHVDPVLKEYSGLLGEHAGQVVELMRWSAIRTDTEINKIHAGFVPTEGDIKTALSKKEVRTGQRSIKNQHGRPITRIVKSDVNFGTEACEASFIAIMHTDMESTVREAFGSAFTPVAKYGAGAKILQGEFGNFENIRFISSSLLGKRANAGATVAAAPDLLSDDGVNVNLYDVIMFGADAWVGAALKGQFAVHPTMVFRKPSDSDPLAQRSKAGYKTMQAAKVVQVAHIKKIVCGANKDG